MRPDLKRRRAAMVRQQLIERGITDKRVLEAMAKVQRHQFVDEALQAQAYSNNALPIGYGQTISQPYSVALMASLLQLEKGMKVLEIGTGSGYQAAVLAQMGMEVFSVERIKPLYFTALKRLNSLRYFQVKLKLDDGTQGWREMSPFNRILVTAGGPKVPEPLLEQLSDPGIMLMPLGEGKKKQRLTKIYKKSGALEKKDLGSVQFVGLVGTHAW